MQDTAQQMAITPPSLPLGGGSLQGMGEVLTLGGPTGMTSLSLPLPLPLSAGAHPAPPLALTYNSGAGNSPFGLGWQLSTLSISLQTRKGVPRYQGEDVFLGPDGEVLVQETDDSGAAYSRTASSFQGESLPFTSQVSRYRPRIITDFSVMESRR